MVNPGGGWLLPAGRCLTVQQWHGVEETSSGISGPKEIVDHGRNWALPEYWLPSVQDCHGVINWIPS
jgi:hypothetical protein